MDAMNLLTLLFGTMRALVRTRAGLVAENLALRQQLAVLHRISPRPCLQPRDRCFWVWLSGLFADWPSWLIIVQPETVVAWHRLGFRWFWNWKSRRGRPGRPSLDVAIRRLIRQMANLNPTWGSPRIASEVRLVGYDRQLRIRLVSCVTASYSKRVTVPMGSVCVCRSLALL